MRKRQALLIHGVYDLYGDWLSIPMCKFCIKVFFGNFGCKDVEEGKPKYGEKQWNWQGDKTE